MTQSADEIVDALESVLRRHGIAIPNRVYVETLARVDGLYDDEWIELETARRTAAQEQLSRLPQETMREREDRRVIELLEKRSADVRATLADVGRALEHAKAGRSGDLASAELELGGQISKAMLDEAERRAKEGLPAWGKVHTDAFVSGVRAGYTARQRINPSGEPGCAEASPGAPEGRRGHVSTDSTVEDPLEEPPGPIGDRPLSPETIKLLDEIGEMVVRMAAVSSGGFITISRQALDQACRRAYWRCYFGRPLKASRG